MGTATATAPTTRERGTAATMGATARSPRPLPPTGRPRAPRAPAPLGAAAPQPARQVGGEDQGAALGGALQRLGDLQGPLDRLLHLHVEPPLHAGGDEVAAEH